MPTSSMLPGLAAAVFGLGVVLSACGSNVTTATGGTGASGFGGGISSTGDVAPGTGGVSTGPGNGGGGPLEAGVPVDAEGPPDSSVPIDAGPIEGGPTCPAGGDACSTCLSTSCADAYCACYGNVDCGQLFQCVDACAPSDKACPQGCYTAHANGISAAALLGGCAATKCPQGCPGNVALTACEQCLYTKCDVQTNTCVANAECTAYLDCTQPCNGDPTCLAQCQAAHPSGLVDASKLGTCAGVNCPGPGACG